MTNDRDEKKLKNRNKVVALMVVGLVIIFYCITIVRMSD